MSNGKGTRGPITVTANLANIIKGNPGVSLSVGALRSISSGETRWFDGCVRRLYYGTKGSDLDAVDIDGAFPGSIHASNLNDFKDRFEWAACCGARVAFCLTGDNRIVMLHVYPCECPCEDHG